MLCPHCLLLVYKATGLSGVKKNLHVLSKRSRKHNLDHISVHHCPPNPKSWDWEENLNFLLFEKPMFNCTSRPTKAI